MVRIVMGILDSINGGSISGGIPLQNKLYETAMQRLDTQLEELRGLRGKEGIRKAAQGFASLFILQMLQEMRKTVPDNSLFGGKSFGMDVFTSMLDEKIANRVAQRQSMGLTEMIAEYLEKRYESAGTEPEKTEPDSAVIPKNGKTQNAGQQNQPADLTERVGKFFPIINTVAREIQLDPDLIKAVIAKESGGIPDAVSKKGAKGLMQLMDSTAAALNVHDIMNPAENIRAGARYLKQLLVQFEGELPVALAAYNAGPGAVQTFNGIPPYPETRNYIQTVMKFQEQFRRAEQI